MYDVEWHGFDELMEAIEQMPRRVVPLVVKAMDRALLAIEGRLKEIPPAGPGNQPGRIDENGELLPYYERNRGEWYPVKQQKTLGGKRLKSEGVQLRIRGVHMRAAGVAGYKLGKASEQLSKNFNHEVQITEDAVEGTLGNKASYAPRVVGMDQLALFEKIGWPRVDKVLESSRDDINADFGEILDQIGEEWKR
jgi:hypothetical protein